MDELSAHIRDRELITLENNLVGESEVMEFTAEISHSHQMWKKSNVQKLVSSITMKTIVGLLLLSLVCLLRL